MIEGGLTNAAAALQFNVTAKTVAKWVKRFRAEGVDGLRDRSSRPHSFPSQTPAAACAVVEALRRQRYTGKQIARRSRDIAGDRQPHPAPARAGSARRAGAGRADPPLLSAAPGRDLSISISRSSAGSALWDIASPEGGTLARSISHHEAISQAGSIVHVCIDDASTRSPSVPGHGRSSARKVLF